jgi:DNA-binding MarR family transcriptional regulator
MIRAPQDNAFSNFARSRQGGLVVTPLPAPDGASDHALEAMFALRSVIIAGERFRHAVADHLGVGLSETIAMSHLSAAGPTSPRQLATSIGLTPSTVTALLDRLAAANLAVRQPHPTDRRKSVIVITDHGHHVLTELRAWLVAAVADLDPDELPQTTTVLTAVAAALTAQTVAVKASPRAR